MTWALLSVELGLCAWIAVMMIADLILPPSRKASLWSLALLGIVFLAGLLLLQRPLWIGATVQEMFLIDRFAGFFKGLFLVAAGVVIVMTREFSQPPRALAGGGLVSIGAFYLLLLTALLGMLVLASTHDLLLLFLGLELLTFSLYIMAAYLKTDTRSVEAGMKYLVLGSVSSGLLVYGIALLYGFAGSTNFQVLRAALATTPEIPVAAKAGLLLVLAGLGFKVAAVPFHLWVPDVYEGAPTPVVALLSVGSKMAGVVAILRLLYGACMPLRPLWEGVLVVGSGATMLYGNLGAIPQTNIKRLLGYSSIGHAGYLLMGLSTASAFGASAVGYYLLAYLVSNLTVFLVVVLVGSATGTDALEGYRGLSKRSPLLAAALFVGLLSLAGVPPLAGFAGKLFVLLATVESRHLGLVAIGAVNVAVSLYYYLMVVKRMYLDPPGEPSPIAVSGLSRWTLIALLISILLIGVFQDPFLQHIRAAIVR